MSAEWKESPADVEERRERRIAATMRHADVTRQEAVMHDRESIAAARSVPAEFGAELAALAAEIEDEAEQCSPPTQPHYSAAIVARTLVVAPYVSLALHVHTLCVKAGRKDLDGSGFCLSPVQKLGALLADVLWGLGLQYSGGSWYIDARRRAWRTAPAAGQPALLAWDVDGVLPIEREGA